MSNTGTSAYTTTAATTTVAATTAANVVADAANVVTVAAYASAPEKMNWYYNDK